MSAVQIRLLGGFGLDGDAAPPEVRGLIPQGVLARLALAGGEAVAAAALVDEIWPHPPDEVLSSLRAHISRLRARGWRDVLSGGRDGYRLSGVGVDVLRMETLVVGGGPGHRVELEDAVSMWHPGDLEWARSLPFAARLAERMEALHRRACVDLASLHSEDGDDLAAAGLLTLLVRQDPSDREAPMLLATALARAGRSGEALDVLDAHREATRARGGGVGVEVESLRQSIVRHDPGVFANADSGAPEVERVGVPHPLTRFVGRVEQLRAIRTGRSASRLITLTGAAGVGKTRLAIEAAHRADAAEDEIQWLVDLTPATDATVLSAVAVAVRAPESTLESVQRTVGRRRALLILDNAEHVLATAAALCTGLLGECARLGILVTSREALRLPGERIIQVPPLLGEQSDDAVELFLQRATDASGVEGWDATQLSAIGRLCSALDGLPLAIELAASRLDVLTLAELTSSIGESTQTSARGTRHESIDTAIEWSTRLTTPAEQELLGQLALFAGPFTLGMVAGVCTVAGHDVRHLLVALTRKSLVHALSGVGERRFRLLESVRQYVIRFLPADDTSAWSQRHVEWFVTAAEAVSAQLRTAEAKGVRAQLRDSQADYQQALEWSIRHAERIAALRLLSALAFFWAVRGPALTILETIDRALDLQGPGDARLEAHLLRDAAYIAAVAAPHETVLAYNRRSLERARMSADPTQLMLALVLWGFFAALAGDIDDAERLTAEAGEHRRMLEVPDQWPVVEYLTVLGVTRAKCGRPTAALDAMGEAFRLSSDIGYTHGVAGACLGSGRVLIEVGRGREALHVLRTCVLRYLENDEPSSALAGAAVYAVALVSLDRAAEAAEVFGAVAALGVLYGYIEQSYDPGYEERAREQGRAALRSGEWDHAWERGRAWSLRQLVERLAA